MKKLLLLTIVTMLSVSTAAFAEGQDEANNAGADCGERVAEVMEVDAQGADDNGGKVIKD